MKTLRAKRALLPDGWHADVAIDIDQDGQISGIETGVDGQTAAFGALLPAPVNVHSHAFQRSMAGLTEQRGASGQDSFWTWRKLMFSFLDQLTPEDVEAITAFVQMEMLESGYATNVEFHYLHHQPGGTPYDNFAEMSERVISAAQRTGIGLTLLPVQYQYGGCDKRALTAGQVRFGTTLDQYQKLHDHCSQAMQLMPADSNIGIAPHSLRAVGREELMDLVAFGGAGPIHIHLAEQRAEVEEVQTAWGARPVEWLVNSIDVGSNWCPIHCTQMTPEETVALARTQAVAGLCPITESSLGDGIFDGVRWLDAGGAVAVGSDSNIRISLSEELRTLEYSQRLRDHSRAALATTEKSTGRRIFDEICAGGARAAGRQSGALQVGNHADVLALDTGHIDLDGLHGDTILDTFIFSGDDRMITDVWSAGRHKVRDGKHVDKDQITQAYAKTMARLRAAL